jgi:hypothetical protein
MKFMLQCFSPIPIAALGLAYSAYSVPGRILWHQEPMLPSGGSPTSDMSLPSHSPPAGLPDPNPLHHIHQQHGATPVPEQGCHLPT